MNNDCGTPAPSPTLRASFVVRPAALPEVERLRFEPWAARGDFSSSDLVLVAAAGRRNAIHGCLWATLWKNEGDEQWLNCGLGLLPSSPYQMETARLLITALTQRLSDAPLNRLIARWQAWVRVDDPVLTTLKDAGFVIEREVFSYRMAISTKLKDRLDHHLERLRQKHRMDGLRLAPLTAEALPEVRRLCIESNLMGAWEFDWHMHNRARGFDPDASGVVWANDIVAGFILAVPAEKCMDVLVRYVCKEYRRTAVNSMLYQRVVSGTLRRDPSSEAFLFRGNPGEHVETQRLFEKTSDSTQYASSLFTASVRLMRPAAVSPSTGTSA